MAELPEARSLERACAWIDVNLARFRIDPEPRHRLPSLKSIGELAHAADLLGRRPEPQHRARARTWMSHGWDALQHGAIVEELVARTPRLVLLAALLPAFARAGLSRPSLISLLEARAPLLELTTIEWCYVAPALAVLGVRPPPGAGTALAQASILITQPEPWTLGLEQMYQLTHEAFYSTDWALDARGLSAEQVGYLDRWLPCWIADAIDRGDTDLLAELVLATHCMPAGRGPRAAWQALADAQREDGAVRPPTHRRVDFGSSDADGEDFARHHHPTLVGIMAWAAGVAS